MINQEKVLRMTKMASYEEHGGRKDRAVVGYFRSDYIGKISYKPLRLVSVRVGTWYPRAGVHRRKGRLYARSASSERMAIASACAVSRAELCSLNFKL